jgi:hypothetical protein
MADPQIEKIATVLDEKISDILDDMAEQLAGIKEELARARKWREAAVTATDTKVSWGIVPLPKHDHDPGKSPCTPDCPAYGGEMSWGGEEGS